ncbi:IS5 family transposase [Chelativorans sp. AA-79]|uniref:IS5 family transposase n=1 Tax=Chelativorans sp. AA-79 TaxID=3028735 RepID=UPI0023F6D2CA|nr:IS5 family transposase [Chelativorans sp. AA-79]WEX12235.1 IS5 family transposase [Chelativorans sp. AA-79]
MRGQAGFFDIDERYVRLSEAGDPLEKLNAVVPWEVFRKPLAKALKRSNGAKGGRPPYDPELMFKVMVLQALYGLSDDQAEFQIQDRLSFMRFLGLGLGDRVPDAKTIWLFREHLTQARAVEKLFARFDKHLAKAGYLAMGGQIVDATIVAAPKQRNTDAEKADIKAGKVPDAWNDKPAKLRQKDRDARWTVKFSKAKVAEDEKAQQRDIAVPAFGYKNHASIDRRHGFIRGNTGSTVWADTAYRSKKNEAWLERNGYVSDIHQKKPKDRPMSEATSRANGRRSKTRAFVEHVFAHQKSRMDLFIRTIGIARARTKIGMANLAYNLTRYVWHERRSAPA